MILSIHTKVPYDIVLERGCLKRSDAFLPSGRRAAIVTDSGVPAAYAEAVTAAYREPVMICVAGGEDSKSFDALREVLGKMADAYLTRQDCVVAVGGGVVGDLAGFAASVYMRGLDFYYVPTTALAQMDASVGGKTAINFAAVKNLVGSFWQPKKVLIDPDTLVTLPQRQLAAGLAEAVKMGLTLDPMLFALFEERDPLTQLDTIIERSLRAKARIVSDDERESGPRRILNFGHTIGHAIESTDPELLHGECVALGMLPMCAPPVRRRLLAVLQKLGLPTRRHLNTAALMDAVTHDKKSEGGQIMTVQVAEVGSCSLRPVTLDWVRERLSLISEEVCQP